jgi:hypothetical protein
VPLNLAIKIPLASSGSHFFFGAGPYMAIGVGGKRKTEGRQAFTGISYTITILNISLHFLH